jgi:hypothetical protein
MPNRYHESGGLGQLTVYKIKCEKFSHAPSFRCVKNRYSFDRMESCPTLSVGRRPIQPRLAQLSGQELRQLEQKNRGYPRCWALVKSN